ncbi:MAG: glycosyltransferase family 92 protein [Selenomonadaceae bacterium]|nr:glycosyltransferase family 92 protein [Selenomonadaceae bacterium]
MVDKNLFPYNLAVVAIFKDEATYLREWLDYHLLAGAEHFYLYNNDSSDDYEKILAPYVEANLVTLIDWSGEIMQMPAYNDALNCYRFFCRYMAFIDLDEFIFPKTNQSIVDVLDEILSRDKTAAALAVNWQIFGSNGHESANLSKGVLERFTRRAEKNWAPTPAEKICEGNDDKPLGNVLIKTIANPRAVNYFYNPHFAIRFVGFRAVNETGNFVEEFYNLPVTADKIAVNHYYTKSHEEFLAKFNRGRSDVLAGYSLNWFDNYNRNEIFDDGILKYRAARAQNFSLENDADKIRRVEKILIDTLTQQSPFAVPAEFFAGKLETFLTCRKLAEVFGTRIGNKSAEEYALVWIYQTLDTDGILTYAELQLLLSELPALLNRPFPVAKKIAQLFSEKFLPAMISVTKSAKISGTWQELWKEVNDLNYTRQLLNSILR